jgi:hypothetical protein
MTVAGVPALDAAALAVTVDGAGSPVVVAAPAGWLGGDAGTAAGPGVAAGDVTGAGVSKPVGPLLGVGASKPGRPPPYGAVTSATVAGVPVVGVPLPAGVPVVGVPVPLPAGVPFGVPVESARGVVTSPPATGPDPGAAPPTPRGSPPAP